MARTSLTDAALRSFHDRLRRAQQQFARAYPGDGGRRQPVHVVYGGAHLFTAETPRKLGALALRALDQHAPDALAFAAAIGIPTALAQPVHARVVEKLRREPVEDYRIDFEDGYGLRPDAEEDAHAMEAAAETARALEAGALPPFFGIRIKALSAELAPRALRTLDLYLTALCERSAGRLPANFVVTLPKVTSAEPVAVLADALSALEAQLGLPANALRLEIMIEAAQALLAPDGTSPLPGLPAAARGRCAAAHFGAFDFTASLDVVASQQSMGHPACELARQAMKLAFAGTGLWLSDGATTTLPVGPHRAVEGAALTEAQSRENRRAVHGAWRLHADDVRRSLNSGFYQGWDLHPAQLPSRYGAVYAFFLEGLPAATARLKNFVARAAQATLVGGTFDDAATGQGLLNFFLRGLSCGALTEAEASSGGVTAEELRGRSFAAILAARGG